ncbi:hypothetical protein GCG54_00015252 [Colletotrichum gloeosporioides]|uniref:Uncharacterized protein n=1 Tax=Colletotrichum gloeosporioides TaxID=474922 RepID=A0A8H4C7G3_COLGL|nr:uncharacterized protein GCG54_00015252 [Colletotrichum gloeosporioides]KAF3798548.1 hypothetical protein GCG54_00015252 [Colletotrichum gloeosporioides]
MAPPLKCHGTLISDLSEKGSGARIRWPANARLLMYAHLARHKLHLGNCQNHRFSELVKSLDLDHGVEFNTAVHPRLQSALKYSLESLSKMGHVELSRGSQRRHVAIWEPHTDEWAKPGWDGSLGGPENEESDSGDEMSLDIEYTQPVQLSSPEFQLAAQNQVANTPGNFPETTQQSPPSSSEFQPAAQLRRLTSSGRKERMNTPANVPKPSQQFQSSSSELQLAAQTQRLASNDQRDRMNVPPGNFRGPVMLPSHPKTAAPQTGHPTVRVGSEAI